MLDDLKRVALFGSGVAELTRNKAEAMVKDLVEKSKQNRKEMVAFVRDEVQNQIRNLGLVTKRDYERLERRIARLEANAKKTAVKSTKKKAASGRKATAATTPPTTPPAST